MIDRGPDIRFLQQFRAYVADYLGPYNVPSPSSVGGVFGDDKLRRIWLSGRMGAVRQNINQGKARAQSLLAECGGLDTVVEPVKDSATCKNHRLFDVLFDNPLVYDLPATFFLDRIDEAIGVLLWKQQAAQSEGPHESPQDGSSPDESSDPVELVQFLARRFPRVAAVLGQRHNDRPAFDIRDEYDVQDLFCGMLMSIFDDVRREEPAPSHAGSSTRIDIVLANEGIMIEVKMTRPGLEQRKVKEQLMVDIPQYCRHPNCEAVIAFVYDPTKRIHNPDALQNDLSSIGNGTPVHIFIVQG